MGEKISIPISRRNFTDLVGSIETPKVKAATVEKNFKFDCTNIPMMMSADVCVCGGGAQVRRRQLTRLKMAQKLS